MHIKVDCEELDDLEYGKVEYDGTHVGAKATYSCDYGYKLVGPSKRWCQYNGYWSYDKPECKKGELTSSKLYISDLNHTMLSFYFTKSCL